MKQILLTLLLTQLSQTASLWGLKADTQDRLSAALELSNSHKLSKQNKSTDNYVTVGGDSTCDFRVGVNKIQNAIDSGATEIRIASNAVYEENVIINDPNVSLTLRGGFADCAQAELNNQSDIVDDWTEITRVSTQSGSVFDINGLSQGIVTVFENIKIVGGNALGVAAGASIRVANTDSDLILDKVWLTQGSDLFAGGALAVLSSNTRIILRNTDIFNNSAIVGGGIFCDNTSGVFKTASIIITQSSNLYNNTSDSNGGGAFIGKDCLLSSFSGSSVANAGQGIFNNSAGDDGGGVYAINGGGILIYGGMLCDVNNECFGNEDNPASVYGNQADTDSSGFESGGGLYASGMGSDITIIAGHMYENTNNSGIGGAIALFENASLTIAHPRKNNLALSCWDADRCNLFNANTASSGGVIYNSSNSQVRIEHAYFEDNRANSAVVISSSGNAVTEIYSSVFNNNGNNGVGGFLDNSIIEVIDNATTRIKYSTFADNNYQNEVFHVAGVATHFGLNSSIVHDSNGGNVMNNFSSTSVSVNCVMAHETTTLPGTNNSLDDPEFVDRINRNYHLNSSNSPAIDYCNFLADVVEDIDYQNQGFDNINLSNFLGPYDLGADEAYPQNFVTIGGDASCDFNTATDNIQDAIRTGIQEIRLANTGTYNIPVSIDDIDLILRGGYANCDDALNSVVSNTRTPLSGTIGPVESIIYIEGNTLRNSITLENLILFGSDNSAISATDANAEVVINNTTIGINSLPTGLSGGAIFASAGNTDFILNDTIITENRASDGGGIYCDGDQISIKVIGNSSISDNIARGKGGGVHAINGCNFTMYSGTSDTVSGGENKGIQRNKATEQGGGIYANFGASVVLYGHEYCDVNAVCFGDNTNPVNVNDNLSDSDSSGNERGGGIYLTGIDTTVEIYAGLIQRNIGPNGAGIYVNDRASLSVARLSLECWDTVKCNYFHDNRASGTGGAIQNDQGLINVSSTYFEDNRSISGSALYAFGALSNNRIEGSVFNNNAHTSSANSTFVIRAAISAKIEVVHSTFADNSIDNNATFGITTNSELKLFSSIINDPEGVVLDSNPGTTTIDCVMAHETTSFTGTNVFLNDPDFIDRNNRDYHLNVNSPAIDVCDNNLANIQFKDIDFQSRGMDNINIVDINGTYDIGADETTGSDVIFKDGFE